MKERVPIRGFVYEEYMAREEIPVHRGVIGVDDVTKLPRAPWRRTGGNGTFIELEGPFEAQRGLYVMEIPPGGQLKPERHLFEEEIFILQGQGICEVWQGPASRKITFEWSEGSAFAFPRNSSHAFYNGSNQPAVFLSVNTGPEIMNAMKVIAFVFDWR